MEADRKHLALSFVCTLIIIALLIFVLNDIERAFVGRSTLVGDDIVSLFPGLTSILLIGIMHLAILVTLSIAFLRLLALIFGALPLTVAIICSDIPNLLLAFSPVIMGLITLSTPITVLIVYVAILLLFTISTLFNMLSVLV